MNRYFNHCSAFFALTGLLTASANAQYAWPYESDFESSEGFDAGFLVSDPEWAFDSKQLTVEIIDSDSAVGAQSLRLTGMDDFSFLADDLLAGQIRWVDFYLKPVFVNEEELPQSISTLRSAVTSFVANESTGQVFVINGDGLGGGIWVRTEVPLSLTGSVAQDWLRLTYRLDYAAKSWDLFLNGQLVEFDLGFLDNTLSELSEYTLRADATTATGFDSFYAGAINPIFPDADNDAIDDSRDLNPALNDRDLDPDGDTLSNIAEFQAGTEPLSRDVDGDRMTDPTELIWGLDPNATDADLFQLTGDTWETGFELVEGYVLGALDQQLGWTASGVDVTEVQNGYAVHDGPAEVFAEHYFGTDPVEQIWFSFDAKLHADTLPAPATLDAQTAAVFVFSDPSTLNVLDPSSGTWLPYTVSSNPGVWNTYAVFLDYQTKTWSLYLNGAIVATDLDFNDPSLLALSRFKALMQKAPGSPAAAYMDDLKLYSGDDFDADGLGDNWERHFGLSPATADANGNGIADRDERLDGDSLTLAEAYSQGRAPNAVDDDVDLYVDAAIGSDSLYNGQSAYPGLPTAADGPKATVSNALTTTSNAADIILIQSGSYDETTLSLNGQNRTLRLSGAVTLR